MSNHIISIDSSLCTGCGCCVKDCVSHNLTLKNGKAEKLSDNCIKCAHCVSICPKGAVSISGFDDIPVEKNGEAKLDPDTVLDTIRFRRSIRQFKDKEIPRDVLQKIIEAGRITHTGANAQDASFTVLESKKDEAEKIAVNLFRTGKKFAEKFSAMLRRTDISDNFFFFGAPTVIVVSSKSQTNGILAAANMEFVAEACGLGVLYSGFFTMCVNHLPKLKKLLGLPQGKKAATTLVIGYPNVKYQRSAPRENADVKYI